MTTGLSILAAVLTVVCVVGRPLSAQGPGRSTSPGTGSLGAARGCPTPAGIAKGVSPGDVSLTNPDTLDRRVPASAEGHTVFYADRPSAVVGDTGHGRVDSTRRGKGSTGTGTGAATVRSHALGDIAVTATPAAGAKRSPTRTALVRHARAWTVQVASYETLDEAQALQGTLCARGYEARILGSVRPYDVRVGRYATSDSALAVARRLRSRQLTAFATPVE